MLSFPKLKDIKSCKRHNKDGTCNEYKWCIFDFPYINTYCQITYNEDDNGKIYLDMMQNGYCDRCSITGFNKAYPATADGYKQLMDRCQAEFDYILTSMMNSNKSHSIEWRFGDEY